LWALRDKDNLAPNCGDCQYRYTCGGCRARAYNYFKDVHAPDPSCVLNKDYWNKVQEQDEMRASRKRSL